MYLSDLCIFLKQLLNTRGEGANYWLPTSTITNIAISSNYF